MVRGTRLPDARRDQRGGGWEKWDRIVAGVRELLAPPGAYMKVLTAEGDLWCWYIRDPNGDASSIRLEHHSVEEHRDGTITVSPSILVRHGKRYHGFLRRGVWS